MDLLRPKLRPNSTNADAWRKEEDSARRSTLKGRMTSGDRAILKMSLLSTSQNNCASISLMAPPKAQRVEKLLDLAFKEDVDPNKPYGRFGQPLLILVPTHPDIMTLSGRMRIKKTGTLRS